MIGRNAAASNAGSITQLKEKSAAKRHHTDKSCKAVRLQGCKNCIVAFYRKSRKEGGEQPMLPPLSERGKTILDELVWQLGDQLGVELTYKRIDPEERERREAETCRKKK